MNEEDLLPLRNPEEQRLRAGLRIFVFLMLLLAVSQVVRSLASLLFSSFAGVQGSTTALSTVSESMSVRLIAGAATLLSALISVWVAGRLLDRRPFASFGFALGRRWLGGWLFGFIVGALAISGVFLVELALGWASVTDVFGGNWRSLLAVLGPPLFFAFAAFAEDLIYWGYLMKNVSEGLSILGIGRRLPVLLALAVVAAFFAFSHVLNPEASLLSTLNIFVAGFMLSLGYVLTGQLAIPIGLHFSWNLFQSYVFGFPVSGLDPAGATLLSAEYNGPRAWSGGEFGPEAGILGIVAMLAVCATILLAAYIRGKASISPDISTFSHLYNNYRYNS